VWREGRGIGVQDARKGGDEIGGRKRRGGKRAEGGREIEEEKEDGDNTGGRMDMDKKRRKDREE